MAYCTSADVKAEFKSLDISSVNASVPAATIDAMCDQASAYIDGYIDNRYAVPVTGTASLLILKMIAIILVKARVISLLSVKTPVDKTKQDPDGLTLIATANKMLDQISKGVLGLVDATLISSEAGMDSRTINGICGPPQFHRGREEW